MADFLTRLAMRIGEPEGFVRPRLPSLFEPSHLDPALPAGADAAITDVRTDTLDTGFRDAPDESSHVDAPDVADARPGDAEPNLRPPRERRRPRSARSAEPSVEADAPLHETPTTARTTRHESGPMSPEMPRGPQAETVGTIPSPARRTTAALPAAELPAAPPPLAISPRRDSAADAIAPLPQRAEAEGPGALPVAAKRRSPAQQADILRPRVVIHDRPVPFSIKHAPAAEPTIHVTIGRVEVRAVTSAATPGRKGRDASPVMSLDEYLRTRAR